MATRVVKTATRMVRQKAWAASRLSASPWKCSAVKAMPSTVRKAWKSRISEGMIAIAVTSSTAGEDRSQAFAAAFRFSAVIVEHHQPVLGEHGQNLRLMTFARGRKCH